MEMNIPSLSSDQVPINANSAGYGLYRLLGFPGLLGLKGVYVVVSGCLFEELVWCVNGLRIEWTVGHPLNSRMSVTRW
jgi:hypothetical protein